MVMVKDAGSDQRPAKAQRTSGTNGHDHELKTSDSVKVICVGLIRTGLESLHRAMDALGYSNVYDQDKIVDTYEMWEKVLKNRAPRDIFARLFDKHDVVIGIPSFCFWEDILETYPDAQVILTIKDETRWWQSTKKAFDTMENDVPGAPLKYGTFRRKLEKFLIPSYYKFCEVLRFSWATKLGASGSNMLNESATRSIYRQHNAYVLSHPSLANQKTKDGRPKLLVMDISEGWEPLCAFLGKDVPDMTFPRPDDLANGSFFMEGQPPPAWFNSVTGFHSLFHPDRGFALKMRDELLRGLMIAAISLLALFTPVLAAAFFISELPGTIVALVYIVLLAIAWNTYGVLHRLILRMPLLMVVPVALQTLFIAAALHTCFISVGLLKEYLVTRDRVASPVLILSARVMSIVLSATQLFLSKGHVSFGAPLRSMSYFAATNELSTWAGYEMLKYVSFPIQVMAKSCKMLPNMIMGRIAFQTQYSTFEYLQAFAALVCVGIMAVSDAGQDDAKNGEPEGMSFEYKLGMGITMLVLFFACDSFTSQWQTALYQKHPSVNQTQMMLGGNVFGLLFTLFTSLASFGKIRASLDMVLQTPEVLGRVLALGVVSAIGQFVIYYAIKKLGSLHFTWIMTARQLISVLISLIFFSHGVNITKIVCIIVVFGVMSWKQVARYMGKAAKDGALKRTKSM